MPRLDWHLGWWSPHSLAIEPEDLIDPRVHGPLLAAAGLALTISSSTTW
jgi:hypothetical protein